MKNLIWDTETNGLLDEVNTLHCLVLRDLDTDEILSCADQPGYTPLDEGLEVLANAERAYAHNAIGYDLPVLRILRPEWRPRGIMLDTLVMGRACWPDIRGADFALNKREILPTKMIGRHSLEAWGYRLGIYKGEFAKTAEWCTWSAEMQEYCIQDTEVTAALVARIRSRGFATAQMIEIEHRVAEYLHYQERGGWPFDLEKATALQARLSARREELAATLTDHFGWWYAPSGITEPKRSMNRKDGQITKGCPYTKIKQETFNPASRDHIALQLQRKYGWKPTEFTPTGKPEVSESTLKGVDFPVAPNLIEYLTVDKRLGQLSEGKQAWLKQVEQLPRGGAVTGQPHIHHRCNQSGTVTHRAAHSHPNLGQVPRVTSAYGPECRELFRPPPGWWQLGADASGLELRCLAHYASAYDGGEYARIILEGDIHAANRDALGLTGKKGRDDAKTFILEMG